MCQLESFLILGQKLKFDVKLGLLIFKSQATTALEAINWSKQALFQQSDNTTIQKRTLQLKIVKI
jgi:hypothetical protein